MDYIINPMIFYWFNVLHVLNIISIVLAVISGIILAISIVVYFDNVSTYGATMVTLKLLRRLIWIFLPICIVSLLLCIFIPSRTVMFEMLVAKMATKENINLTVDSLKSVIDYIIESINSLK